MLAIMVGKTGPKPSTTPSAPRKPAKKTNLIVVRVNLASQLKPVRFQIMADGTYKARDGRRVTGKSRIQIAEVVWRKPVAGMTTTVVVNCHMHRMAAKKHTGFADGYKRFFDTLAQNILNLGGRFVAGDWNMSLWAVADELRQRRIECTIGAMFAWRLNSNDQVKCDSMGIFLCGPVTSVRVLLGPGIFQDGDETELLQLNAGAGFV